MTFGCLKSYRSLSSNFEYLNHHSHKKSGIRNRTTNFIFFSPSDIKIRTLYQLNKYPQSYHKNPCGTIADTLKFVRAFYRRLLCGTIADTGANNDLLQMHVFSHSCVVISCG